MMIAANHCDMRVTVNHAGNKILTFSIKRGFIIL